MYCFGLLLNFSWQEELQKLIHAAVVFEKSPRQSWVHAHAANRIDSH
jgi:hypothetical protein